MPSLFSPPGPPPENDTQPEPEAPPASAASDAPVSFVPHTADGAVGEGVRIRTGRYGVLEEHELIRLLDTMEDERARGRFRESIYISVFVWLLIAGVVLFGPRYLWHAPQVKSTVDILKERELATLSLPLLPHPAVVPPRVDTNTLERLRTMTREAARRAPAPESTHAPAPAPAPPASLPNTPTPAPRMAAPTPPAVQPSRIAPPVADAPTPQGPSRPNFNLSPESQGVDSIVRELAKNRGGGGDIPAAPSRRNSPIGTGVQILSDTQGVDFDPYLRRILSDIKRNWLPLLPEEVRPPLSRQGEDQIRFKIAPDGSIMAMVPEWSTHDEAIDRSCWSAITSENQFPPLPKEFHGPDLELRIHFLVNKGVD